MDTIERRTFLFCVFRKNRKEHYLVLLGNLLEGAAVTVLRSATTVLSEPLQQFMSEPLQCTWSDSGAA